MQRLDIWAASISDVHFLTFTKPDYIRGFQKSRSLFVFSMAKRDYAPFMWRNSLSCWMLLLFLQHGVGRIVPADLY